jgi:hypothetical protein
MISIIEVHPLPQQKLELKFDDGSSAEVDLVQILPDAPLTRPLRNWDYFKSVQIYEGGDGIYWPNEFDLGADMLHDYVTSETVNQ